MIQIRHATADDVPWLLDELRSFDQFAGLSLFPDDEAQAAATLRSMIDGERYVFFVAVSGEHRKGFITGYLGPHHFNPRIRVLTELFWWVRPDARGTFAGARLLDAFNTFALEHADWAVMTLEAGSPDFGEKLERRGYVLTERSYRMVVARPDDCAFCASPVRGDHVCESGG